MHWGMLQIRLMDRLVKGRKNNLERNEDSHINDIYFYICESLLSWKRGANKQGVFRDFKKLS